MKFHIILFLFHIVSEEIDHFLQNELQSTNTQIKGMPVIHLFAYNLRKRYCYFV